MPFWSPDFYGSLLSSPVGSGDKMKVTGEIPSGIPKARRSPKSLCEDGTGISNIFTIALPNLDYFAAMRILFSTILMVAILSSCHKMKPPEFRGVQSADLGNLGLAKSELKLRLSYYNPNRFTGQLKWAEGEAWLDSLYIGPFRVDTPIVARPLTGFEIPVTLQVDMKQALFLTRILAQKKKGINDIWLKIEGKARAGRNGFYKILPFKSEGLINF